ncbi:MAG: hypothetical protein M1818_007806 [Claussenomyces sp. TS43310]|nr:MAG: hypothetical protein M1818_007806 [Claussenomyces sp. TS43310]
MSNQRYERVSHHDEHDAGSPVTPTSSTPSSPPPSFRSRTSSPSSRHAAVDATLADTFDADGADSEEENDGDDRQRLMRGEPAASTTEDLSTSHSTISGDGARRPPVVERRVTHLPVFAPSTASTGRVYGGGSQSDGVFSNLNAKPDSGEKLEEHPPTYEQAAADAAPPYWETTILAPGLGGPDEVYVDGLPVGSVFSFIWNGMISMSFQLVGFLLTYLLHTTHAAKNGSRAGLGITLVQYGFYMKSGGADKVPGTTGGPPPDPNAHDFDPNQVTAATEGGDSSSGGIESNDWVAYGLMIVGWFILIRAVSDFLRARRHEKLVLQSPERGLNVPVIATGEAAEAVV